MYFLEKVINFQQSIVAPVPQTPTTVQLRKTALPQVKQLVEAEGQTLLWDLHKNQYCHPPTHQQFT